MILTDESPMPFGKHEGTPMANVPANYLMWMFNSWGTMKPWGAEANAVRNYIIENLDALKLEMDDD
jgi:hypothetical protein